MRLCGGVLYRGALLLGLAAGCAGSEGRSSGSATAAGETPAPSASVPQPPPRRPELAADPAPGERTGEPRLDGVDFISQARLLWRVAACAEPAGAAELPAHIDPKIVDGHCKRVNAARELYQNRWLLRAMPFLAEVVPDDLPRSVVYPFGGGDLLTALAVYPEATEITAISLEGAGDPRAIDRLTGKELRRQLAIETEKIEKFLRAAYNRTYNLNDLANSDLPGLLVLGLVALDIHGYEPVALRYFRLQPDGTLRYLSKDDLAAADAEAAAARRRKSHNQLQVGAFTNVEVRYRKAGDPAAPVRVYRHIAENLSDNGLAGSPLVPHLRGKGKVSMMTKAAAYLLWREDFSVIRDLMLEIMAYMVSDDSGIPNKYARKAGFVQDTYGTYAGAFGHPSQYLQDENIRLWKKNPQRDLPFVFGYPARGLKHMMITRRP